ncbi:hypothetical protein BDF19DRAFT_433180 [Syncephalis fuscata]|nr:hypothetical protein BDF19DRAFT_433180 [Syncephalis fuscata]
MHLSDWKDTCQAECLKIGPNIQFNRCYDFNEANVMCKCNDQDLTSKIIAMFKPPQAPPQVPSQTLPQAPIIQLPSCVHGAWDCDGNMAKLCSNSAWFNIAIVCK